MRTSSDTIAPIVATSLFRRHLGTAVDGNAGGRHIHVVTGTDLLELVSSAPATCHGQPCIKGTRVLVTLILDALAAGLAPDDIVRHYPTLTQEGVRAAAAAAYGAWLAKQ